MRKNLLICCCLLMVVYGAQAQRLRFGIQTGIAGYALNELKDINLSKQNSLPFKTKLVSDFPSFVYFQPSVVMEKAHWNYGLFYSFYSTGSRISASDYSADYLFDARVNAHTIGITGEYYFYKYKTIKIGAYSNIGLSQTNYKMKESLVIGDSTVTQMPYQKYKGYNAVGEPGLMISLPYHSFQLTLNAGYGFQLSGSGLVSFKDDRLKLQNPQTRKNVKAQWNGYKVGIAIYYSLPSRDINE